MHNILYHSEYKIYKIFWSSGTKDKTLLVISSVEVTYGDLAQIVCATFGILNHFLYFHSFSNNMHWIQLSTSIVVFSDATEMLHPVNGKGTSEKLPIRRS